MNKLTVAGLVVPLFSYPYAAGADFSSGLKTRGLFGGVEYGYIQERASDTQNTSLQESLTQNYTLGKRGFVYSPNLLSYLLQGSMSYNETQSTTNDVPLDSNFKNTNYRINTDFIRTTNYPFSLYGEKTSTPFSSVQPGSTLIFNQSTDRYGFNGSAKLPYFELRYSAEASSLQREESFANEVRDNKDYMVSIFKDFNVGTFSAVYNDRLREYARDDQYLQSTQSWNDHLRDARINGSWNIDKTLRLASTLNYMDNTYADMKNLSGNVNVNWQPSERYTAGVDLFANTINAGGFETNTLMLTGNSFYQMTPEFSTTQNVSLNHVSGNTGEQNMGIVTLGGHYNKALENEVIVNAGVDVMGKSEQYTTSSDMNVTIPDRNTYSYTVSGGASKMVESLRSRVSGNVSYYDSASTTDDKTNRLTANMMLFSTLSDSLTYTLSGYLIKEESQYYAGVDRGVMQRDVTSTTIDNILRYWKDIGYNGKFSLGTGVTYTVTQSGQSEGMTRVYPHIDGNLNYRFFQSLILTSTVSASQDSVSDLTNYSGYLGLNYTLRKIIMSFGTRYLQQTGGTMQERTQSSTFFKISRSF